MPADPPVRVVDVFDTTLRDGEQSPGSGMTGSGKLAVARQLAALGVSVIEAGFPAAAESEAAAVARIAREFRSSGPVVCGMARATKPDIDRCAQALRAAGRSRIHTFLATSDIHLEHKLRFTRQQAIRTVAPMVRYARDQVDEVEFSPEDATRSSLDFLFAVLDEVVEAGARILNVPDTVGYATPEEYGRLVGQVVDRYRSHGVMVSVHCHDDLGLAAANSLAGIAAGAHQVECTVNGIGERAGNAALEEVVMALKTRTACLGVDTAIDTRELVRTSRLVERRSGIRVPPNKAVVGRNAFAHQSGIHQAGVLAHRGTYEIMSRESVGFEGESIVLGKLSGRHALKSRLQRIGVTANDGVVDEILPAFKRLAGSRREVTDTDLTDLVNAQSARGAPAERGQPCSPKTMLDKIWDRHVVVPETAATPGVLFVDLHLIHEVTSPQAFSVLDERGLAVRRPDRTVATVDHSIPTLPSKTGRELPVADAEAALQLERLRGNCRQHGVHLFDRGDPRQGIVHVIGPELGLTLPGMTVVCGDSHTSTHGALGALAFGIGTSEVGHVLATQCLLQRRPRSMEVRIEGTPGPGVTAKDVTLAVVRRLGAAGGTGSVIEYRGSVVRRMTVEERLTLCNMSIEAGARAGMVAPDDTTFDYLASRPGAPAGEAWKAAVTEWRALASDPGARFDRSITLDVGDLAPMITFGTTPAMAVPIDHAIPEPDRVDPADRKAVDRALLYMGLEPGATLLGHPIDVVFLGSCTNSRLSDLEQAARVLRGRRVAPTVRMLVVPGSRAVQRDAEALGLHNDFLAAGAEWRDPGCSMCIAMNGDELAPGQYAVSTSNRNFEGRQGKGGRTFLASPLTAAASAVTGVITDPRTFLEPSSHA